MLGDTIVVYLIHQRGHDARLVDCLAGDILKSTSYWSVSMFMPRVPSACQSYLHHEFCVPTQPSIQIAASNYPVTIPGAMINKRIKLNEMLHKWKGEKLCNRKERKKSNANQIKIQLNRAQQFQFYAWNLRFHSINVSSQYLPWAIFSLVPPPASNFAFIDHRDTARGCGWMLLEILLLKFVLFHLQDCDGATM